MTVVTDISFRPEGYKEDVVAYGTRLCRLLSFDKSHADDTVLNADSYKTFATGITLNQIDWYQKGYEENTGI